MKFACAILAALIILQPEPGTAQLAGRWTGEYDAGITHRGDAVVVTERARMILDLQVRHDSVFGTWMLADAPPGARPQQLTGIVRGNVVQFTTGTREVPVTVDGKKEMRKIRTDWTGQLNGNTLTGSMLIWMGDDAPPRRSWSATRA